MQPGDLITYRHTHKRKQKHTAHVYIVRQVNDDGTIEAQSLKTGLYKSIKRPEFYFVTKPASPPDAPSAKDGII